MAVRSDNAMVMSLFEVMIIPSGGMTINYKGLGVTDNRGNQLVGDIVIFSG